jgi:hypothetical protein
LYCICGPCAVCQDARELKNVPAKPNPAAPDAARPSVVVTIEAPPPPMAPVYGQNAPYGPDSVSPTPYGPPGQV